MRIILWHSVWFCVSRTCNGIVCKRSGFLRSWARAALQWGALYLRGRNSEPFGQFRKEAEYAFWRKKKSMKLEFSANSCRDESLHQHMTFPLILIRTHYGENKPKSHQFIWLAPFFLLPLISKNCARLRSHNDWKIHLEARHQYKEENNSKKCAYTHSNLKEKKIIS